MLTCAPLSNNSRATSTWPSWDSETECRNKHLDTSRKEARKAYLFVDFLLLVYIFRVTSMITNKINPSFKLRHNSRKIKN